MFMETGIMFIATMSKTRPGAYKRIIDVIASVPIQSQSRYFIHVEVGIYVEIVEVWVHKTNIVLTEYGKNSEVLTNSGTYESLLKSHYISLFAAVKGNRFMAKYITLENSAGEATQAGKRSCDEISGFVIQNSTLTAAPDLQSNKSQVHAFLGRPWFAWSTVIVMQSFLESIIDPARWYEWPGHRTDELTDREYGNWGAGADTGRRISWVGYKALNRSKEVIAFTVSKFIQADSWIPDSGILYTSGLY
ncbi:unnamed protein product [Coffea canephora]|uniref:Pectinesterase n=1 Tax=Coffea canephora TaxID=49390 RepID=A0A068V918_COFCA|nr:unnamed protein product [Coffea canephora]